MAARSWLAKSEPFKYAWSQLVADGRTTWDGVRNFEARNNLRAMAKGDHVLFYHSNEGKEVVGVAQVVRTAYADPTSDEDWSVVDVAPLVAIPKPVTLAAIKAEPKLAQMELLRRSRLSVVPVREEEFLCILHMGSCRLPKQRAR
jgi:predicted RNA-binding protein with PUA-like domain